MQFLTDKQCTSIQAETGKGRSGNAISYDELSEWARVQLKLPFSLSFSVLSRPSTALSETGEIPKNDAKRRRYPSQAALEHQLLQWINAQYNSGRCLTGGVIHAKAMQLLEEVNALLPQGSQISFKSLLVGRGVSRNGGI